MGHKSSKTRTRKQRKSQQPPPPEAKTTNTKATPPVDSNEVQENATPDVALEQTHLTPKEEKGQMASMGTEEGWGFDGVARVDAAEGPFETYQENLPMSGYEKVQEAVDIGDETNEVLPETVTSKDFLSNNGKARKEEENGESSLRTAVDIIKAAILFTAQTADGIVEDGMHQVDELLAYQRRLLFQMLSNLESKIQSIVLGVVHRAYALQLRTRESSIQAITSTKYTVDSAKQMVEGLGNVVQAEIESWTGNVGKATEPNAETGSATTNTSYRDSVNNAMGYVSSKLAEEVEMAVEKLTGNVGHPETSH